MKLYYSPGACSLAIHISLREAGLPFALESVNIREGTYAGGKPFTEVNPKGYVPVLRLDDDSLLTEGVALQQWIADQAPHKNLLPPAGTRERYTAIEWLAFITSELHKSFGPLFNPTASEDSKKSSAELLLKRFAYVDEKLKGHDYLMGSSFSAPDSYLFTVFNWSHYVKLDVSKFTNILAFCERMKARPSVREAYAAEGLKG
jgi:glutathione S-transferase